MSDGGVIIRTETVILREPRLSDALDDYLWMRDPDIARAHGTGPLLEPYSTFLPRYSATLATRDPSRFQMALDLPDDVHIGTVIVFDIDSFARRGELGITIGPAWARGQGIGRAAIGALLRHLWDDRQFDEVYLHTFEWNTAGMHCFAACGFTPTGYAERAGHRLLRMSARRDAGIAPPAGLA